MSEQQGEDVSQVQTPNATPPNVVPTVTAPKLKKPKLDLKIATVNQIANMNANMNGINDKAEDIFKRERDKWSNLLSPLYSKLSNKDKKDIVELQSESLAIREQLQQSISYHSSQLSKANVTYKNAFGDRLEFYMTGFGIKTASSEKTKMVDRDLAEAKRRTELLEVHIDFLRECRYSCDQIGYAIKNLTEIYKYLQID